MPDPTLLSRHRISVFLLAWFFATPAWANVTFQFDYSLDTTGFFGVGTAARATLEAAGDFYEDLLKDDLEAISPGGQYREWKAQFYHPSSGAYHEIENLYVPRDTLIVYVGARDLGTTLGQGGPGGWEAYGYLSWLETVGTRGEGTTQNPGATDFAPWGGAVAVDLDANWNLDYQTTPSYAQSDLYSVLFHELGHVLGIGTCDSWNNLIDDGQFTGPASVYQFGGNVPLSGTAHWAYSTQHYAFPGGAEQEAMMDPNLTQGARKVPTYLDLAGLDDLGWDITLPPRPGPLPGDLNEDGFVGGDDLDIVRSFWGQWVPQGNLSMGDPSGDGFVGGDDLDVVRSNWGQSTPPAPAAVPEPSTTILLLAMGSIFLVRRIFR